MVNKNNSCQKKSPPPKKNVNVNTIHGVRTGRPREFLKPKDKNLNHGNT
jgi:hypothetical protein